MNTKKILLAILLSLGCFVAMGKAPEPKYYLFLFAHDDGQMTPENTHTWAAYFKMNDTKVVASESISWLPKSGVISPMELGPERGINKPFDRTIADAAKAGFLLRQFGPYEVTSELWDLLEKRRATLAKEYWYRILDTSNRVGKALEPEKHPAPFAVTCIHAITDAVIPVDPKGYVMTDRDGGIKATARTAWHLSDWYVRDFSDPHKFVPVDEATETAMAAKLGLAAYPQLQKLPLTRQNNRYCRVLSDCDGALSFLEMN